MVRGVVWAYGLSFVAGLVLFVAGIRTQTDPILYPLLAFLSGAIGVAVALRMMGTRVFSYLVALSLGIWHFNLNNVLLGVQTLNAWLDSSAFIAATVIGGRLLVGSSFAPLPSAKNSAPV